MHEVLVNRLGGLSLSRKSVVRLTDRPDMTLDVYRGRKTTIPHTTLLLSKIIEYCKKGYERSGKNLFWSIKNSFEVINKLKSRVFRAASLSTYDFSTLYTTLPHKLIKYKLVDLI